MIMYGRYSHKQHKKHKSKSTSTFASFRMCFCFCVFVLLWLCLTESVERATGSYINSSVGDRGCRVAFVVEFINCQHLPVGRGFQDRNLTTLTNQKHFVVSSHGR